MKNLEHARFQAKDEIPKVPEGATIVDTKTSLSVKEIENGFLIEKQMEAKYVDIHGNHDWLYHTKRWFSKENPMEIDLEKFEEKTLADNFK